ncbi:class I adenylate-forming enzyme family protein [Oryzicola mucosus]|uniref:3-methylmercaptopropionyl-CoA ligase n=1 Tax=Oryzicola mucosus TaxID=2767425 RepID=A0A8J6PPB8_9HYPH|nr:long-chain-fatty-acid--CoA ligase [Oryzicola mucosus]MBD0417366.1 long-chain-fatty-acid--CoA ligase [Oryzicola mucosus]
METLGKLLDRNAQLYGSEEALVFSGRTLTYDDLRQRAGRLSAALYRLGLRRQDRLAILAMNCPEYLEVYGAGHLAGYIISTVNFRLTLPEMEFVTQDSAPTIFIFEAQYAGIVGALRASAPSIRHFICIGDAPDWALSYEGLMASEFENKAPIVSLTDDYAHLMYSSGTTGRPKGVIKTHRAELARGEIFSGMLRLMSDERSLVVMPLFHTGATSIMLAAHWIGGSVVLHRKFDPNAVLRDIEAYRVAMTHMAPTLVRAILDSPDIDTRDLSSLKTLFYAAAPMPVALLKRAIDRFGTILANGYGMTEGGGTFLQKHYHRPDGNEMDRRRLFSVGHPTAHAEIRVVDGDGEPLPPETAGEIVLKSPTVMACYWNNSVATRQTLRDGWLSTGDVGVIDKDGFVYLVDRKKDMIISGGENIYCQEVEQVLMNCDGVREAVVLGVPDDYWGENVAAFVIREPHSTVTSDEITAYCNAQLARYKVPKSIVFVEDVPRVTSGKVDKRTLKSVYLEQAASAAAL